MIEGDEQGTQARVRTRGAGCLAARDAAAMLERACRDHPPEQTGERQRLYLESAGGLARDLCRELAALSEQIDAQSTDAETPVGEALVSAALRAADLANLAACALPELPPEGPASFRVAAAARLASGAARSLSLEQRALATPTDYAARDLRGAEWRASLAARQVDEALQEEP